MNNTSGINDEKLDSLVLDIYDYADRINQILNNIDELISMSNEYFKCESADQLKKRYQELELSFPVLKQNILNCANDLVKAKYSYQDIDSNVKQVVLQGISKIDI